MAKGPFRLGEEALQLPSKSDGWARRGCTSLRKKRESVAIAREVSKGGGHPYVKYPARMYLFWGMSLFLKPTVSALSLMSCVVVGRKRSVSGGNLRTSPPLNNFHYTHIFRFSSGCHDGKR